MSVEAQEVRLQLDTGASCNVISQSDLPSHVPIQVTCQSLMLFDASRVQPVGKCTVRLLNPKNGHKYREEFVVVERGLTSLFGAKSIQQMKLITLRRENILQASVEIGHPPGGQRAAQPLTLDQIVQQYSDVFDDKLGQLEGRLHLDIDPTVTPVQLPARRIPVSVKDELITELDRLERDGLIERIDKPTDWVSALVVVRKPKGGLRICIDPKLLNRVLKRCHYPIATIDDLLPRLKNTKVFSVCDVRNGFGTWSWMKKQAISQPSALQ